MLFKNVLTRICASEDYCAICIPTGHVRHDWTLCLGSLVYLSN